MSDSKKKYMGLQKKYGLPPFDKVDEEFEIHDVDEHFVLRNVLRKIGEKIEFYLAILADLLQPDTSSLSSLHETRFFISNERGDIYVLFKKLMRAHRSIIELSLSSSEQEHAAFLKMFMPEWQNLKKELLPVIKKMKESWEKDTNIEEDVGYFG